ncbi:MAG: caspase family protein [Myxococcota bacterium]
MRFPRRLRSPLAVLLAVALPLGCSLKVTSLEPRGPRTAYQGAEPLDMRVRVEGAPGLVDFLRQEMIFAEVAGPLDDEPVDLVIKARTDGAFAEGGAANFFTYFPGAFVLVPSFRGIRWRYDASAEAEAFDAVTNERVGRYQASSSHELVHRATVFGSFFSAIVIVPAIVRGASNTKVRPKYEQLIYQKTYRDLWQRMGSEMMRDQGTFARIAAKAKQRRLASARATRPAPPPVAPRRSGSVDASRFYSKRVAVVVGIDDYRNWPNLEGARGDAERMAHHLRQAGFDEVIEVYDEKASRRALLKTLGRELGSRVDDQSLAFIYFAGHGQTETLPGGAKRGYLVPVDADLEDVFSTAISMETVRDLSNRMRAKHVMYAIDACYSGLALTRGISRRADLPNYLDMMTSRRAVQIITAGSEGEQAVEVGGQGLFTTYLLRGLEGEADIDGDGAVTASELGTWVRPQVTLASQNRQSPQFGTIDGSGDAVFGGGR